jgi:hypothetical protein
MIPRTVTYLRRMPPRLTICSSLAVTLLGALVLPASCAAVVQPASVLAGPANDILDVDGSALAPDGSGGVLYRQEVGGVAHLFAVPFADGHWSSPVEVDGEDPYGAHDPAIAAGDGGRLLVVWVQPRNSNASGVVEYELVGASLQPGANAFGQAIAIDPNVGEPFTGDIGAVEPKLAMAPDGAADVVYRVTLDDCGPEDPLSNTACPPNSTDKLVLVRFSRFEYLTWSHPKTVNRAPQLAMLDPTAENAPAIGVDLNGDGVVAWQEPGNDGIARIWVRRLFGTVLGNVLQASPEQLDGQPIAVNADAPTVSVGPFGEARIAFRIDGAPGEVGGAGLLFVNSLPSSVDPHGYALTGPVAVPGALGALGLPSVAIDPVGNYRLAWAQNGIVQELSASNKTAGQAVALGTTGAAVAPTAIDSAGGGATAWTTPSGESPAVEIREDYPQSGYQTARRAGDLPGPVSGLSLGGDGQGDGLLAWMQGSVGSSEVVGDFVQAPPTPFEVFTPSGWVTPAEANISWSEAPDAAAGVTYSVYVDGRRRIDNLSGFTAALGSASLGDGVHRVQVLATDSAGQQTMSAPSELKVDSDPPIVKLRLIDARHGVNVGVGDEDSGVDGGATRISWGDGARTSGRARARHDYRHAGVYTIVVSVRDNAGNSAVVNLRVRVR